MKFPITSIPIMIAATVMLSGCLEKPPTTNNPQITTVPDASTPKTSAPHGTTHGTATISGEIVFTVPLDVPSGSRLSIVLADVSLQDVPFKTINETIVEGMHLKKGLQSLAFSISYDPSKIDPRYDYSLVLRLEHAGKLLYINDEMIPVLGRFARPGLVRAKMIAAS